MRRALFILISLLAYWSSSAQDSINIYADLRFFPTTIKELGGNGPVKSVIISQQYWPKNDTLREVTKGTYYFDKKGLLIKESLTGRAIQQTHDKDSLVYYYNYDSLGRFLSMCFWDGSCRNAIYDEQGNFIYYTSDSSEYGVPQSRRYYYDGKRHCTYDEYIPTIDEDYLEYGVMRHAYEHDALGHCTHEYEIVDGDTSYERFCQYDIRGNILSYGFFSKYGGGICTDYYHYNENDVLLKSEHYYNSQLHYTDLYEYNDQGQLIRITTYNEYGTISYSSELLYDSFSSIVEYATYYYSQDGNRQLTYYSSYQYEYY